jgi:hypothetical protein
MLEKRMVVPLFARPVTISSSACRQEAHPDELCSTFGRSLNLFSAARRRAALS